MREGRVLVREGVRGRDREWQRGIRMRRGEGSSLSSRRERASQTTRFPSTASDVAAPRPPHGSKDAAGAGGFATSTAGVRMKALTTSLSRSADSICCSTCAQGEGCWRRETLNADIVGALEIMAKGLQHT